MQLPLVQNAPAELPQQHIIRWPVLGVVLEARALEVLHHIGLTVFKRFWELLAERIAELRQPAIAHPVAQKAAAQVVAGLTEKVRASDWDGGWVGGVDAPAE